jgi:hypothetical protein
VGTVQTITYFLLKAVRFSIENMGQSKPQTI